MKIRTQKSKVFHDRFSANRLMSIFIFSFMALLMSCATPTYRLYEGDPMPQEKIAVLITPISPPKTGGESLYVLSIDGRKPRHAGYFGSKWDGEGRIELLPGEHTILVLMRHVAERAQGQTNVNFIAKAGKTYILRHSRWSGMTWNVWVAEENIRMEK